jgi:hypothetical protein
VSGVTDKPLVRRAGCSVFFSLDRGVLEKGKELFPIGNSHFPGFFLLRRLFRGPRHLLEWILSNPLGPKIDDLNCRFVVHIALRIAQKNDVTVFRALIDIPWSLFPARNGQGVPNPTSKII